MDGDDALAGTAAEHSDDLASKIDMLLNNK
jgi:hypothetical protein